MDDPPTAGVGGTRLFVQHVRLDPAVCRDGDAAPDYPFGLPAVRGLAAGEGLRLEAPVTFLVGHNGSGKSTLVEAIAVAVGFNPEGGSTAFRFSTAATHSPLGDALIVRRGTRKPRSGYFLRAESFYNVASEINRLDAEPAPPSAGRIIDGYGGVSLHQRSHGESFIDLLTHRLRPDGLYVLDEPESALSPQGALAALARIHHLAARGAQFIIATHSPILLALPGATILEVTDDGTLEQVGYDTAMPVTITRGFLADPDRHLRALLDDP